MNQPDIRAHLKGREFKIKKTEDKFWFKFKFLYTFYLMYSVLILSIGPPHFTS
jgi:hypothetical protein